MNNQQNIVQSRNSTRNEVMNRLGNNAGILAHMLPPDLPIDRFRANIVQAFENFPAVLDATPASLFKACMKAAYDGLRLDGKEAAIVVRELTVGKGQNARKVKTAQYMPMAFGLVQQILRGKEVASIYAEVVRDNDDFHFQRGTSPGIHHIPSVQGGGKIVAAYSVAKLANGETTFEVLSTTDLAEIRSVATTDNVWDKWEGEMSKKSAIRRHRKTLPIGNRDAVPDAEHEGYEPEVEDDMRRIGGDERPAMPTRANVEKQIAARSDTGDFDDEGDYEDAGADEEQKEEPKADRKSADDKKPVDTAEIPDGPAAWGTWENTIRRDIAGAKSEEDLDAIALRERPRIEAADKELRQEITGLIGDRMLDFVTDGGAK